MEMGNRYFYKYGDLDWLDPVDFYDGPWTFVGIERSRDGEQYDIVRNLRTDEYCYTCI